MTPFRSGMKTHAPRAATAGFSLLRSAVAGWAMLCLASAAAVAAPAETGPIYAPCLTGHTDIDAYAAEMEGHGWEQLAADSPERAEAVATVAQPGLAVARLTRAFEGMGDVSVFLDRAARWGALLYRAPALVFRRDGVSASVLLLPDSTNSVRLSCVFAAPNLPEATEILGDRDALPGFAFSSALVEPDGTDETDGPRVAALRFEGPALLTALLTGRHAIFVDWSIEVSE